MPFLPMDDNFPERPSIEALSDRAWRLHLTGLFYVSRTMSDGLIPLEKVPRLVPNFKRAALDELLERLVWQQIPASNPEAFYIAGYLDEFPTREQILKRKAEATERKRKWRERHGHDS